jgi:hypothetical protein
MKIVRDEDNQVVDDMVLRKENPANIEGSDEFNEANKENIKEDKDNALEQAKTVVIENVIMIAKLTDGTRHIVNMNKNTQLTVLSAIAYTNKGMIPVEEKVLDGITWESEINLTVRDLEPVEMVPYEDSMCISLDRP